MKDEGADDLAATIMGENIMRLWAKVLSSTRQDPAPRPDQWTVAHGCGTDPLTKLQAVSIAKSTCLADVLLHCEPKVAQVVLKVSCSCQVS